MTRTAAMSLLIVLLLATSACGKYGRPKRMPRSRPPAAAQIAPEPAPAPAPATTDDAEEAPETQP